MEVSFGIVMFWSINNFMLLSFQSIPASLLFLMYVGVHEHYKAFTRYPGENIPLILTLYFTATSVLSFITALLCIYFDEVSEKIDPWGYFVFIPVFLLIFVLFRKMFRIKRDDDL